MEEKIMTILNEMAEYLNVSQMKKAARSHFESLFGKRGGKIRDQQ